LALELAALFQDSEVLLALIIIHGLGQLLEVLTSLGAIGLFFEANTGRPHQLVAVLSSTS
jgi:hypothetical protein